MRLFIAIEVPVYREFLLDLQRKLPTDATKLTLARVFHLTLRFLGEINDLNSVKAALDRISFKEFSISLDSIGFFPDRNHIRVVWIGVMPQEPVKQLAKQIDDSLLTLGFRKNKDFHPHITLARVRFIKDRGLFVKKIRDLDQGKVENININSFKLIRSTLTPNGPVYKTLKEYKSVSD